MKHLSKLLIILFCLSILPYKVYAQTSDTHSLFNALLQQYVSEGEVDYAGIQKDARFSQYLELIEQARPDTFTTDKEKLAFWINAYNALSIKGILDGLSPSSLLGRYKFFKSTQYKAGGKQFTLDALEKEIIIPFGDPRIHFAIVCASASCPKLISEAYTADKLDKQLDQNTRAFLNNTDKNKIDGNKSKVKLSKIFDWFAKDFEDHSGSVQKYIAKYVDDPTAAEKLMNEKFKIKFLKYDWSLNGTPPI